MLRRHIIWRYKNSLAAVTSVLFAIVLSQAPSFHSFLLNLHSWGYIGAFFAGFLFASTFTVATGSVILLILAEKLIPWELALVAGFGAVFCDFLIFRFVKDGLTDEIREMYHFIDSDHHLYKLFHSGFFSWTLPVVGALLIATPLPDEVGVSLLGISRMNTKKFVLISYVLHTLGIFFIVSLSKVIHL